MSARDFLGTVIASGLELEMLTPDDVIELVTMDVLAHHLPVDLKARLLAAALKSSNMSASLVLDTLGVEGIVEHSPAPLLWHIVAVGAQRALGKQEPAKASEAAKPVSTTPLSPGPRKPNISARVSRIRAGATSRPSASAPRHADDDSAFDVDTRVGLEQPSSDFDVIDEANVVVGDDITAHGKE